MCSSAHVQLLNFKLSESPFTVQRHVQYMLQKPQPDWKSFAPFFHPARTPSPLNKLTFPTTEMTTSTNTGQFAGDVPLTGHNIQKHSINTALREGIPDNVVRLYVYGSIYAG